MKKQHVLWLFVSLILLAIPVVQTYASDNEVEIELMEVAGFIPGDNPFDDPIHGGGGNTPPQPGDFSAAITGSTLTISSGTHSANVVVRNSAGTQVLNRQFVGGTIEQIPAPGSYSLEIQSGSLTLVGMFDAE